jgi:hypothetical protein
MTLDASFATIGVHGAAPERAAFAMSGEVERSTDGVFHPASRLQRANGNG